MAWATFVSSELLTCDANFEAFDDGTNAIVITLNPHELLAMAFSIASEVGETDDLEIQILGGSRITTGNGLDAVTSATVMDLDTAADSEADDYYMGMYFLMTSGGEVADLREVSDYTNANDRITLARALSGTPSAAETYDIFHMSAIAQFLVIAETVLTEDLPQNATITVSGYEYIIARARATGATDAHAALMTYQKDGVSA